MAVEDTPPPPPPPSHTYKITPFSIPNKDARALNLDNELRSIKIGKMTVNEYCTKIKSMTDRLKNLGCVVSDKNLEIYTINGLDSRFATLVEIIHHRETLPTFETTRTMLLLKESSFTDDSGATTTFESSSSSPTVLMTSASSSTKDPNWCNAMYDEYNALVKNDTWILVPRSTDANLAPHAWFQRFAGYATRTGFSPSRCDSLLFIYTQGSQIIDSLHKEFDMTDLGTLNYFLGISVVRHPTGQDRVPVQDPTLYRSLAGGFSILPSLAQIYPMQFSRSTFGYCVFLETAWIRNLLRELHSPLLTATLVYCDNVSAVYMSANPVQHQRTKHIEIGIHFVRDMVKVGHVQVLHVSSRFQYADIFTKGCDKGRNDNVSDVEDVYDETVQFMASSSERASGISGGNEASFREDEDYDVYDDYEIAKNVSDVLCSSERLSYYFK
uniref:Hybrid signal transduction histidine kinase M n=1 Tax=Tanacetum cinerariifolium TaxID=118510 RepID=A0A6L2KQJ1_TANCI|nr:hybrid signal transduction histidine kinase M [Tanacetum cinerariifolium]